MSCQGNVVGDRHLLFETDWAVVVRMNPQMKCDEQNDDNFIFGCFKITPTHNYVSHSILRKSVQCVV